MATNSNNAAVGGSKGYSPGLFWTVAAAGILALIYAIYQGSQSGGAVQSKMDEIARLETQGADAKTRLANMTKQHETVVASLKAAEEAKILVEKKLSEATAELSRLKLALAAAQAAGKDKTEFAAIRKQHSDAQASLAALTKKHRQTVSDLAAMTKAKAKASQGYSELEARFSDLEAKLDAARQAPKQRRQERNEQFPQEN